jgi:hypothetical protein
VAGVLVPWARAGQLDDAFRTTVRNRVLHGAKVGEPASLRAIADRITEALEGRGREVMGHLFAPEERAKLARMAVEFRDISTLSATEAGRHTSEVVGALFGGGIGGAAATALGLPGWIGGAAGAGIGAISETVRDGAIARAATNAAKSPPVDWRTLVPQQRIVPTVAESFARTLPQGAAGFFTDPPQRRDGLF